MRHIAIGLVLAATAATAAADDRFEPWPHTQAALTFVGHGTRVGSQSEGGMGGNLELAVGSGRFQAFAEATLSSASFERWTQPAYEMQIAGTMFRAAGGARWLARQWMPDPSGAFELYLLATAGAERFAWNAGGTLTRPEFSMGWGFDGRVLHLGCAGLRPEREHCHQLAFRLEARVLFTPTSNAAAARVACRGMCTEPMPEAAPTGFLTSIGVSL